jgi:hypothetical protein
MAEKTMSHNDAVLAFKAKLEKRLILLFKRNRPLAKYLYIKWPIFVDGLTQELIKSAQPKRGPRPYNEWSVGLAMRILKCSRRTAQDYILAIELDAKMEKALWGGTEEDCK